MAEQENSAQNFEVKRIYVKDFSFEAPNGADTFTNPWEPDISIDLDVTKQLLRDDFYEVVLTLTVTARNSDETAFMVEIFQGGIFQCQGFSESDLHRLLHTVCPNTLFPYAREAVDGMIMKASFPSLILEPVNFEALYNENIEN